MRAFLGVLLAVAVTLVTACGEREVASDGDRPRLENGRLVFAQDSPHLKSFVTGPVTAAASQQLRLTGRLVWNEERTVRQFPAFAGRVTRILVKPGDTVKPGQELALLASPDFGQAQMEARRAQSDFTFAEKTLHRLRELHAAGAAAGKDLNAAESDYARAEAELARATNKVRLYSSAGEAVDQNLALTSPIAGVVVERNINPGQELRPDLQLSNSPPMFVITDPSKLWVQLDTTESQIAELRRGQHVAIRSSAWPDARFTATIEAISDFVDPVTRTVKVRGSLDNPDRRLKGEMFVTAELESPSRASVQVPSKAVVLSGDKHYVFVEEAPGRFARLEVKTTGGRDGVTGILSGLTLGQKVVVEGDLFLHRLYNQLTTGASG